ncbi:MAG: carbohydrate porin [Gemmatimonadaceae bacterium]|nr:carbohydrate porin [Gloeobacterales cyanobacterium ES-bin-141]
MKYFYASLGLLAVASLILDAQPARADQEQDSVYYNNSLTAQVNSVSELTDVDPNSWAFQALKSVVERFGVIEGYPDKTFRGNRALTRYEFAAGLNAALEKVNELITAGNADRVTKEDLATLQRLQDEFRTELAALRGRVDALESKTKEIESKLFSTTAKLDAELVFAVSIQGADTDALIFRDATAGGDPLPGGATNAVFLNRTRLNFRANSLITPGDQLRVRLGGSAGESAPYNVGRIDYVGTSGNASTTGLVTASFDKVYYDFPLSIFSRQDLRVRFGPQIQNIDIVGRSKYTQNEVQNFSFRNFRRDPLFIGVLTGDRPGAHIDLRFSPAFAFRAFYAANSGGAAVTEFAGGGGIVGGSTQAVGELSIRPIPAIELALGFNYTNLSSSGLSASNSFIFGSAGGDRTGGDGRLLFNPDTVSNVGHSVYHGRLDLDITPNIALFGRYSYGSTAFFGNVNGPGISGTVDSNTWMAGLAFPDLLGKGNLLEAAYLQPINITNVGVSGPAFGSGTNNLLGSLPRRDATESNIAVAYRFRISDRLSITPEAVFVLNANNVNQNGLTVGNIRASYEF